MTQLLVELPEALRQIHLFAVLLPLFAFLAGLFAVLERMAEEDSALRTLMRTLVILSLLTTFVLTIVQSRRSILLTRTTESQLADLLLLQHDISRKGDESLQQGRLIEAGQTTVARNLESIAELASSAPTECKAEMRLILQLAKAGAEEPARAVAVAAKPPVVQSAEIGSMAPARRVAVSAKTPADDLRLSRFGCDVSSFGDAPFARVRDRLQRYLQNDLGCSFDMKHAEPGFSGNFHSEERWPGLAWCSIVLYYDNRNESLARELANELSEQYGWVFYTGKGRGQGIRPDYFEETLVVHVIQDQPQTCYKRRRGTK